MWTTKRCAVDAVWILLQFTMTCRWFANATTCNETTITTQRLRYQAIGGHDGTRGGLQNRVTILDNTGAAYSEAENLYKFIYSCEYEKIADRYVQGCQRSPPLAPPKDHALNFKALPYNNTSTYNQPATDAIAEWRGKSVDIKATNIFDERIEELANILNWETLYFGCSVQVCGGGIIATVACVYEQPALSPGDEIYVIGQPCAVDSDCTKFRPATCEIYQMLCVFNATAAQTTTMLQSSSTSSTTSALLTTRTSTSDAITSTHSNSGLNQICPSNGDMSDRIRQKAIDMHNYRRSQLSKGEVAKFNGNKLPTAANMLKLRYDCELERLAIAKAKACSGSQPSQNSASDIVDNTYVITDTAVPYRVNAVEEAIKYWWKQIRLQQQSIGMAVTFKPNHVNQPISSFTMMAWATTRELGCAVARCSSNFLVVCQYRPGGNVVNTTVYSRGTPCTQCPAGTYCSTPLCVHV
uniref:Venom allergen/ancylostoma secreted protein-like 19 isoform 1 n=1 Tax=Heligmosomoides polygyrus bakeri TaxID=375939 RepID=G4XWY7_HELBE|nr:venom allergen/ancylostoma secreted protein-like 19 isoform 1 [Heligmosomoides bakeri]